MVKTKKCHSCKESFLKEQLIDYASPNCKTMYSYCPKYYEEKRSRDNFSQKVCEIFGLKAPGPQIWTERKRIKDKYGYTDNTIIDCLDYVYNIQKKKKLSESLYFVTPTNVELMLRYKKTQEYNSNKIIDAMKTQFKEYYVEVRENIKSNKTIGNPDDWINDDDE